MVKRNAVVPLTGMVVLLSGAASRADGILWASSWNEARAQSKLSGKPLMVDFYTDWCGWCKKLDADTYQHPQVVSLSRKFVMLKLNAETGGAGLAKQYDVKSFPNLVFFDRNGVIVKRWSGYVNGPGFSSRMEEVLKSTGGMSQGWVNGGSAGVTRYRPPSITTAQKRQVEAMRRALAQKNYSNTYVLEDDGSAILLDDTGARPVKPKKIAARTRKTRRKK